MNRKIFLIFVILLFIYGCAGGGKTPSPEELIKDIYKGTDGLVMEFMKGAPPEEVYEDSPFQLNLEIENKGAYDIKEGIISIGLEKDYMRIGRWLTSDFLINLGEDKAQFDLEGKSQLNPKGDKRVISLTVDALRIKEEMSEKHTSVILATACYKYQTKVMETVCIDTDVHNILQKEKVCKVEDLNLNDQGAPVAMVSIESSMLPDEYGSEVRPEFIIHIENKGNGQVIKENSDIIEKACSAEPLGYENINLVGVSAFFPDKDDKKIELNCGKKEGENKAYIKLKDNEGLARCVLEEGIEYEEGTFLSPLTIVLDYGYMFTISKEITISKVLTY